MEALWHGGVVGFLGHGKEGENVGHGGLRGRGGCGAQIGFEGGVVAAEELERFRHAAQ